MHMHIPIYKYILLKYNSNNVDHKNDNSNSNERK